MGSTSLISPDILKEHLEGNFSDGVLQRIIDSNEAAIIRVAGPHDVRTENFYADKPYTRYYVTAQPILSVVSITERRYEYDDPVIMTANDYEIRDNRVIWRLSNSEADEPALLWGSVVNITYNVDSADMAERVDKLILLCQIRLAQMGYQVIRNPEVNFTPVNYSRERNRILRSLKRGIIFS